jgi:hypothetical protein
MHACMHAWHAWQVTATDDGQLAEPFSDATSVLAVGVGEGDMSCMVPGLRYSCPYERRTDVCIAADKKIGRLEAVTTSTRSRQEGVSCRRCAQSSFRYSVSWCERCRRRSPRIFWNIWLVGRTPPLSKVTNRRR